MNKPASSAQSSAGPDGQRQDALGDVPFAELLAVSRQHREEHACGAYPYDKAALLRVLAAALAPVRVVEVGTALGYTAICMAAAAPGAHIDTIDFEEVHVQLATAHLQQYALQGRVTTHCGSADDVLPTLQAGAYGLAFFDGFAPTASILWGLHRLLAPGGTLVCANLTLGGDGDRVLADAQAWFSYSMGETAIAVRR